MELWEKIYKERKKKVGAKKAKYSAGAVKKAILAKQFYEEYSLTNKIINNWKNKKTIIIVNEEENNDKYSSYRLDNIIVYLSPKQQLLKDFNNISRKGLIGRINDEYEREIMNKIIEKYNIKLPMNLYYVIKEEE